ncbi:MAG: hypothetical protein JWL66_957 [Sphingomonadales bacterium]|nr:hypothetical protein [Sphingomonadales bacterium]
MSTAISAPYEGHNNPPKNTFGLHKTDPLILLGSSLCGTMVLGFIGIIPLLYVLVKERQYLREGTNLRAISVTFIGLLCFQDGFANLLSYSLDTWASHTVIGKTFLVHGYGRHFDMAWVNNYNEGLIPGVKDTAEKSWQLVCIFILFPLRVVATWAFIQMKSWGLHFLRITSWLYLLVWIGYLCSLTIDSSWRMHNSDLGVIGWWVFNFPFTFVPPLTLVYLYTIDDRYWNR